MIGISRRGVLRAVVIAGAGLRAGSALAQAPAPAPQAAPAPAPEPDLAKLADDLMAANRILADQGVLDGYGHVSARNPRDPAHFFLARSMAPELVTTADILEHDLDGNAVQPKGAQLFLERFIHAEVYRVRPDVHAVVHSHSPSVIPFGATGTPLQPIYHMSAFLRGGVPVFDIRAAAGDTDMLVRTPALGKALAQALAQHAAVLMRGHGAVVVAGSIPHAVFRAVYTEMNARLQAQAMALGKRVTYLDDEEAKRAEASMGGTVGRPWELWRRKALGK